MVAGWRTVRVEFCTTLHEALALKDFPCTAPRRWCAAPGGDDRFATEDDDFVSCIGGEAGLIARDVLASHS